MFSEELLYSIDRWYTLKARILPWRDDPVFYKVWISEMMLQQTQVKTVIPYYQRFMKRFPDIRSVYSAGEEEVLKYWAGLGYYRRASYIYETASAIVKQGLTDEDLKDRKKLLSLKGIGRYTAGALLSIVYHQPEALMDGNVERFLSRLLMEGDKKQLWKNSESLIKKANHLGYDPSRINQAMMEIGAVVCVFRQPKCGDCPAVNFCRAFINRKISDFPLKKRKKEVKNIDEEKAAYISNGCVGAVMLKEGEWRQGLYDLPVADEKDRKNSFDSFQYCYRITNHQIRRTVWLIDAQELFIKKHCDVMIFEDDDNVPMTASLRKALKKIRSCLDN